MDIEEAVSLSAFLEEAGWDMDDIPATERERLEAAETVIVSRALRTAEAKRMASQSKLTVRGVAGDMGISRTTVYSDALLKPYIEFARKAQSRVLRDVKADNARLREENARLRGVVTKMVIRDIESERMKHEIAELRSELVYRDNEIKRLRKNLRKPENDPCKEGGVPSSSNVIALDVRPKDGS